MRGHKRFFIKPNNVPPESGLYNRVILVESQSTIHFLIESVQQTMAKKIPIISLLRTFLGICPMSLYDETAIEIIDKYFFCQKWGLPPFESYEKTPKWWIFAERTIESELSLLAERPKGATSGKG